MLFEHAIKNTRNGLLGVDMYALISGVLACCMIHVVSGWPPVLFSTMSTETSL